ncbi:hypothetical protein FHR72_001140 [Mycolicibacterium iranicum]|uniref:Uncharacterized protein n=1 Tax=Mycolicibacterium iranicum TaxID=912594 RepID=A0A839Q1U4_MYCIR|nr:hypothetical protein [Mycolicibacterium iranicum]MBB2989677.1 hypothetical protein [Mycolicibacterium iranicum]
MKLSSTESRYGPASFGAALANIVLIEFTMWVFTPWWLLAVYMLPLLLVNLVLAVLLERRGGIPGQIGRGMLIGLLSVPAALVLFLPGFMLALGLNLV